MFILMLAVVSAEDVSVTVVGGPSYDGTVTGTRNGGDVELTINFGDPDLFMNELTITGTYVNGKISGGWTGIDGSGSVDIDRIN